MEYKESWRRVRHTCPSCNKIEFIEKEDYDDLPGLEKIGVSGKFMICGNCEQLLHIFRHDSHNLRAVAVTSGRAICNYLVWS